MAGASQVKRRGIAMLLVLVCLFTATIIATSYLASRDNSAAIGSNVTAASTARWSAASALEVGVAIMQTETEWRTLHTDGKLLDDYVIGAASVDLDIIDMETGEAPTESTSVLQILATAIVGGVEQTATAVARVEPYDDGTVDLDLSEFAIFARDKIKLENQTTIARWPEEPLSELGDRNALGTQSVDAAAVELTGDAAAIDTTVYTAPGASNLLISNDSSPELDTVELLDQIPMPAPPDPGVEFPQWDDMYPVINRAYTYVQATSDARVGELILSYGAVSDWVGDITVTTNHDCELHSGSKITVNDDATLIVFGNLVVKDASIELIDDASLTIFVRGDLDIDDGYIGNGAYDPATDRDATGGASWMDPQRIAIYSVTPEDNPWNWELHHNSVVKASIYAPDLYKITIMDDSALYGRVAVPYLNLKDRAAIFYDHGLDLGSGYTNPNSSLFDEDGHIIDSFLALVSLNSTDLSALADAGDLLIYAGGTVYGDIPEAEPEGGGSDPTPRTVPVNYQVVSFGTDIAEWEAIGQ